MTINEIDVIAGDKLKKRRTMLGMSQADIAEAVGVTFQQIQKYEKGTNRISASRLYQFAKLLKVEPNYFFDNVVIDNSEASMEELNLMRIYKNFSPERKKAFSKMMRLIRDLPEGGK